jgi:hypothetical protein
MNILIVSDAWEPQDNDVVRMLKTIYRELERRIDHLAADCRPIATEAPLGERDRRVALRRE